MNKKGFAISIVLYSLVFLLIAILYMILGILKARYNVENDLRNAVVEELDNSIIIPATEYVMRVGNLEDIENAKLYVGNNPNNYVMFNGEQWRIIGVYGDKLKIIRAVPLIDQYKYSNSNAKGWVGSYLNDFLNDTYYEGLSSDAKEMIDTETWNIGSQIESSYSYNANEAYQNSQTSVWEGKVGLVSDYEYLYTAGSECREVANDDFTTSCVANDWLYSTVYDNINYAWTISNALMILDNGKISVTDNVTKTYSVNPVVYLKPTVKIAGGKGTSGNEYRIGTNVK